MLTPTRGIHGQFVIKMEVIMCGFLCACDGSLGFEKEQKKPTEKNETAQTIEATKMESYFVISLNERN